jgi:hypothetical protein
MDATAVSKIARAQKHFQRPCTEDTSSKAHLNISVKRVMLITPQPGTAHSITSSPASHLFLEKNCSTIRAV